LAKQAFAGQNTGCQKLVAERNSMLTQVRAETADFLSQELAKAFTLQTPLTKKSLISLLEVPKKLEHGHLAFPVFPLAKELKKAPPVIAQELAKRLTEVKPATLLAVTPVGGFLNFTFHDEYLQEILLKSIYEGGERIGYSTDGAGKTLVIDYSSPNVAKPMHIGHLRATVIGQAIRNIAETRGYKVIGLNHLGDWGVQFGKLAWAYLHWGKEYDFESRPFQSLFEIYVRFHDEAEKNPELEAEGSLTFKRLEEGDPEITAIWRKFVDISMVEYGRLWGLMGVRHDLVRGESFYNDKMKAVEDLLENKGLLEESEGAMVVRLGEEMPPCLIRKSDGASLYATRDLASAIYRREELKADLNLYVVGVDQTLHFRQVFKVLELMGFDWAKSCHHIAFGMYRFKEGKMSTRKGRAIFLEDVVTQAIELVEKVIEEKNPNLPNKKLVAEQVGLGAIIFNDLAVDRVKDVEFDWEKALNFEGDSGPYVQYTHVRCVSLRKKYGKEPVRRLPIALSTAEERELVRVLLNYEDVLAASFQTFRPNILAQYMLEVCGAFSRFYNKNRILGEAPEIETARMGLVEATRRVIEAGLKTLNIQAPEAM
jgi:arginyl-tRNA synthetase